jgi:tetratricopeptide (TPR) repeat protein
MRLTRLSLIVLLATVTAVAETPFALPSHRGAMLLDLSGMHLTQTSAKPDGVEVGVKAHDAAHTELLAFLYLTPGKTDQTAQSCLDTELANLKQKASFQSQANAQGTDNKDFATALLTYPSGSQFVYQFSGSGDQCLSIEVYADKGSKLDLTQTYILLERQKYDPNHVPDGSDKYTYANILYRTKQYAAAVPVYQDLLASTPTSKDTLTVRRVSTDNMGMALGMTGQADAARQVFQTAIKKDSGYPLYYYNLACADAEQDDVMGAQRHLKEAFDRKKNLLPGESMPDPKTDPSILKLKHNEPFWAFVESLR